MYKKKLSDIDKHKIKGTFVSIFIIHNSTEYITFFIIFLIEGTLSYLLNKSPAVNILCYM